MNILQLFSDWKWTGPADPVLNMCLQLQKRGHRVIFACQSQAWEKPRSIATFVKERGVDATNRFHLNHHFSFTNNLSDLVRLRRFIREQKIEIVNTHLSHDHILGALSARLASKRVAVIRTDHYRDSFPPTIWSKLLLTRLTDGILTFSEKARLNIIRHFGIAPDRVARINPALDCEAFHPASGSRSLRQELGIGDHDMVVGVIARFQKYRKMDLFFEALTMAVKAAPNLKALLVGRGSHMQETIVEPIQKLGLEKNVILAGYLTDRYRDGIASMDALVFLIAGSDGTARAMREAMAMGKPVIANNLGMLAELIEDGTSGLVFNDNARELADHMVTLARDEAKRRAMSESARIRACATFSLNEQAQALESFYERILRKRKS